MSKTKDNQREVAQNFYLDKKGTIIPISAKFTAYCLTFTSDKNINFDFLKNAEHQEVLKILNTIHQNPFWKAQIAQIHYLPNGELKMYMQVGNVVIEWGKAEQTTLKFAKLKTFCSQILPAKGWNTYKKVNLKYHHQIVCE
jgi:cell division protein FtsQ